MRADAEEQGTKRREQLVRESSSSRRAACRSSLAQLHSHTHSEGMQTPTLLVVPNHLFEVRRQQRLTVRGSEVAPLDRTGEDGV